MADKLGMSEAQMSQYMGEHKNIGSRQARRIESALGLPRGWMDQERRDLTDEAYLFGLEFQSLSSPQRKALIDLLKSFKK